MANTVIKVENLSKQYRLGEVGTGTLSHDLNRWWHQVRGKEDPYLKIGEENNRSTKGSSDYVWALKDINFEVKQGEVLGIIGRNGAGKSTLLKILSRTTTPTSGAVKIKGRVASLLEVGTGFHPELSGRDNIYLNGAILGMTKAEIRSKFDEIIDFAGVERYIDTPVKRYSSGMYVRLAFAVAAHLDPEILIVDEVLAVGDADFQKKALGKMQDVSKGEGRTILFVSHNMTAVQNLCTKGIFLKNGKVKLIDSVNNIINDYHGNTRTSTWVGKDGNNNLIITKTSIRTKDNSENITNDKDIVVTINLECIKDLKNLVIGFNLFSGFGYPVARASYNDYNEVEGLKAGTYKVKFLIPKFTLAAGSYRIDFDIAVPNVVKICSEKVNLAFDVLPQGQHGNKYFAQNSQTYNSLVRQNWFDKILKENY